MKKRHLFALLMTLILALPFGLAFAGSGSTRYYSPVMGFSGTGWGGWSCPKGTVVVGGGYLPSGHTVLVSEAAKPGSNSGLYPVYPHWTYTPPEEGWVVQNGGVPASLQIFVDCAPPHDYSAILRIGNNCGRWQIRAILRDYGRRIGIEYLASGMWTDPYAYETVYQGIDYDPSYEITFPDGSTAILVTPKQINEKTKCHDFTLNVIETSKCDGYYRKINLRDHGSWIKSLYRDKGPWIDPYTTEMLPGLTVPISDVYGGDVVFDDLYEPEECLVVLEHDFEIIGEADGCDGWSFTASASEGGIATPRGSETGIWLDPYTLESVLVLYDFVWPDGVAFTSWGSVNEPEECLIVVDPEYSVNITYDGCEGYCVEIIPNQRGAEVEYLTGPCGEWTEPNDIEEITVSFVIYQPDGSHEAYEILVTEPENCWIDPCPNLFRMWLLRGTHPDANGILECYVVSPTHPGVVRYQRICWPCLYPDFVASKSYVGWVNACDVWELDDIRMYWRKSLAELLAMNARHAEGIYYPIDCSGCE